LWVNADHYLSYLFAPARPCASRTILLSAPKDLMEPLHRRARIAYHGPADMVKGESRRVHGPPPAGLV
jgi:hypothetical protein